MKPRIARRLVSLYPKRWRDRFGDELQDLLEAERGGLRAVVDVLRAAAKEQLVAISHRRTIAMAGYPETVLDLARRPSGFVPIAMSLAALAVVGAAIFTTGTQRQPDEGAAAHIFQLLIAGQAPILAFFLARWLRKDAKATLTVLALQAAAIGLALLPVWSLGL
jgi:hypothetical protein